MIFLNKHVVLHNSFIVIAEKHDTDIKNLFYFNVTYLVSITINETGNWN